MLKHVALATALLASSPLFAEEGPVLRHLRARLPVPATPLALVEEPGQLSPALPEGTTGETLSVAASDGIPASRAFRVRVGKAYQPSYQVQLFTPKTSVAVKKGDQVGFVCWLRAPETDSGVAYLRLQQPFAPWGSPVDASTACGKAWKAVYAWNAADQDYPAGTLSLVLQLGQQKQVIEISEATKALGFREYDVTNELRDCTDVHALLGREGVAEWYAEARKILPAAKLALNENTILTNGGATVANQDLYLDWYRILKAAGQAPDVMGFQAHFGESFTGAETVWAILDRFARETAAELQITEFDINTADEEAQAAYTRDFMTACFAHPRITGFTMWGFWEGDHWLPKGAFWRKDWTPKPNAKVLEDLLTRAWWTRATATTDAQGRATVRAFLGEHAVTATVGGAPVAAVARLDQAGKAVTVDVRP
jgi:hypothetical protein